MPSPAQSLAAITSDRLSHVTSCPCHLHGLLNLKAQDFREDSVKTPTMCQALDNFHVPYLFVPVNRRDWTVE